MMKFARNFMIGAAVMAASVVTPLTSFAATCGTSVPACSYSSSIISMIGGNVGSNKNNSSIKNCNNNTNCGSNTNCNWNANCNSNANCTGNSNCGSNAGNNSKPGVSSINFTYGTGSNCSGIQSISSILGQGSSCRR